MHINTEEYRYTRPRPSLFRLLRNGIRKILLMHCRSLTIYKKSYSKEFFLTHFFIILLKVLTKHEDATKASKL